MCNYRVGINIGIEGRGAIRIRYFIFAHLHSLIHEYSHDIGNKVRFSFRSGNIMLISLRIDGMSFSSRRLILDDPSLCHHVIRFL